MKEILELTTEVITINVTGILIFIFIGAIFLGITISAARDKNKVKSAIFTGITGIILLSCSTYLYLVPLEKRELTVTEKEFVEICIEQNVDPMLAIDEINTNLGFVNNTWIHNIFFEENNEALDLEVITIWYLYMQEN